MQITKEIIEKTEKYVKKIYKKKKSKFHSWDSHIEYVVNHARYIAKKEKLNVNIVVMGTLLHDIGRNKETRKIKDHGIISAKEAEKYLKKLKIDSKIIDHIKDTIMYHSDNINLAKTKEALAVYDADKLDRAGPRGFIRYTSIATRYTHPEYEIEDLFKKAKEKGEKTIKRMQTKTGKQLAKKYINFTKEFVKGFKIQTKCR